MTRLAITGAQLATPTGLIEDRALLIEGDRIHAIVGLQEIPAAYPRLDWPGIIVSPGWIDIQVNGGGGVLFNDAPTLTTLQTISRSHRNHGTANFLPTLISDTLEKIAEAIATTREAIADGVPGVIGLHLEGPFLNAEKRGIHNADHFRKLDDEAIKLLTEPFPGKLLITLAPEETTTAIIQRLAAAGVVVSAGHTAADYQQTKDAVAAGVTGFTHLFNAMPPMLSRRPGPVAAALESDAWCSLIADGHHVDDAMLQLTMRAKTDGRLILVTDAMSAAGTDATSFELDGQTISVVDGKCTDSEGTLAGSNLTMAEAVRHAHERLNLTLHDALRMASAEPANFLGISEDKGNLSPGRRAEFTLIQPLSFETKVVTAGELSSEWDISLHF